MNILMLIDRYDPIYGGAENQLKQLTPHLQKLGCTVSILTRRWQSQLPKKELIGNAPVVRVGLPGTHILATLSYMLSLTFYVIQNRKSIDLIHSHGLVALGAFSRFLSRLIGKPNVAKIASGKRIPQVQKTIIGKLIIPIFRRSNAIISMTNEIHQELTQIDVQENQIHDIKNGVDIERFRPANDEQRKQFRLKRGWREDDPIIIFSGRFVRVKGLDILIKAWPAVQRPHPQARLIVLGSGSNQNDSIEPEIKSVMNNKKDINIFFEGDTNKPEVYLNIANIFVLSSRREGISNALLEAMASGLAIISSNIGGVAEIIEEGKNGRLFESESDADLSKTLNDLISDSHQQSQLGQNARAFVQENHPLEQAAQQYFNVYKSLIN